MGVFIDKLGRPLGIGDIVACSSPYYSELFVGKITRVGPNTVGWTLYGAENARAEGYSYPHSRAVLSMNDLKSEPTSWNRWTKTPEKRMLILKKAK